MSEAELRRALTDADYLAALGKLYESKELPDWIWHRLEEVSMELAEKRLKEIHA